MIRMSVLVLGMGIGAAASAGATLVACGSESSGTDLTGSDASPDSGSSSGGSSGVGSSGGPRPADDAGVTADGGIDPPNAGPGGDTKSIPCGAATCPIPAETCCVSEIANNGDNGYACVAGATCPSPPGGGETASLKCSGAANCAAGTVCCIRWSDPQATSECKTSCANDEAQLCDPKAGDAGGCPPAQPCSNNDIGDWGKLPDSYGTCGGQGR
jgi:hypothetical protein